MSARSDKLKKAAWAGFVLTLLVVLVVLYERFVLSRGPTLTWSRAGVDYELLSPKMLGLALLAPYFMWVVGKSLADLPMVQRVLSVLLRVAFVALLALGLSRLARTATTQKICTVYLVDVSESVPDAALEDARAEIDKGIKAKGKDDLVRVVTFAKRPRVVPLDEAVPAAPKIERHEAAATGDPKKDKERPPARVRPLPGRHAPPRGAPVRRRPDRRGRARRGEPGPRLRREALYDSV